MTPIIDAEKSQYLELITSLDITAKHNAYTVIDAEQRYSLRRYKLCQNIF